jgi:hypothetical protein
MRAVLTTTLSASLLLFPRPSASSGPDCRSVGEIMRLHRVHEASGLAASRKTRNLLWTHNDSGAAVVFAFDEKGSLVGRVQVTGAEVDDWEDIAVGACPRGLCLYIGDIGDNRRKRARVTVYRVTEPNPHDGRTEAAETFHATYPDGPHDAEALFVTDSDVFLVTKGHGGPIALYRFPQPLTPGVTVRLERIGVPASNGAVDRAERVTGASTSIDGRWVALRTLNSVALYRTADLIEGRWHEAARVDVTGIGEPQGEGVAFAGDDSIFLAGEGARRFRGGTLARLACTF